MRREPKPYEIFTHFKGKKYQILTLATHSETGEKYVVYQAMYDDFKSYVRPYDLFMSETDREKYPDTPYRYRFFREDEAEQIIPESGEALEPETGREETDLNKEQSSDKTVVIKTVSDNKETGADNKMAVPEPEDTSEWNLDPLVIEFLDADTHEARLNILAALFPRITDEMINTMAVAIDIEIDDGPIEQRYAELKNCIQTKIKYERRRQ